VGKEAHRVGMSKDWHLQLEEDGDRKNPPNFCCLVDRVLGVWLVRFLAGDM